MINEISFCLYYTTNLKTGKQYVGDHSTNNLDDGYLGSGKYLKASINKEGKENFKREILELFETKQEAFNAQEKWINEYNTLILNGYNISSKGGYGVPSSFLNEETKRKISINSPKYWLGKKLSKEAKIKNRDAHLGKITKKETKEKISKSLIGIKRSKESIRKSALKRQKITNKIIDDIILLKDKGYSAKYTSSIYVNISIRSIFSIRSGKYKRKY